MSVNQMYSMPGEVIKKLPFLGQAYYYLYKDSKGITCRGVLYQVTYENYEKAKVRFNGGEGDIISGDKVFVIPNCRIPMFKLIDYLKKEGASQTTDITEATKIIGHDRSHEMLGTNVPGTKMMINGIFNILSEFEVPSYVTNTESIKKIADYFHSRIFSYKDNFDKDFIIEGIKDTLICKIVYDRSSYFNYNSGQGYYFLPTAAWIIYHMILKKIPVINEEIIYEKIGKSLLIDEQSYISIDSMLSSEDPQSQKMGAEILANCDVDLSIYYIWKLVNNHGNKLGRMSSFKNIRLFIKMSSMYSLIGKSAGDFICYLYEKEILTKEIFDKLFPEASMNFLSTETNELFKITITPSDKYSEFADGQLFTSENTPDDSQVEIVEDEPELEE